MRIFTEEQVDVIINRAGLHKQRTLRDITPIELPSDEEIEDKIEDSAYSIEYDYGFRIGAKWVIEQIKQQDK